MKKLTLIAVIGTMTFASLFTACGKNEENKADNNSNEKTESEETKEETKEEAKEETKEEAAEETDADTEAEEVVVDDVEYTEDEWTFEDALNTAYSDYIAFVIEGYIDGWQNFTIEDSDFDMSYIYGYLGEGMGFVQTDINGDGVDELIFGENYGENATAIYDIYTFSADWNLVHVACGGERDVFYLTEDGLIYEIGSNGADDSFEAVYELVDDELYAVDMDSSSLTYCILDLDYFANYAE